MADIKPAEKIVILKDIRLKTKSGIEHVSTGKNAPEIGEVISAGKGKKPVEFKKGDILVFRRYMENKVYIPSSSQQLNFVDFKDIVANLGKQP